MGNANRYYSGPPSDHFDGLRFFNPDHPDTDRSLRDLLKWRIERNAAAWPASVPGTQVVPDARVAGLRVTMIGHATALIQAGSLNVLTDPVWSERVSPVRFAGPRRVAAPGVALDDLPPIDVVLLSHNHYDHLDVATLRVLQEKHRPLVVSPLGNDAIVQREVPGMRVVTRDWWEQVDVGDDARVTIVPANHWSARGTGDRRMALWGGFMLQTPAGLVYFAGDTGYGSGQIFREMRRRIGAPDLALIPVGAYAPDWFMRAQHTNPDDAVRVMLDLEAKRAIGIHWGVFQLTDEPYAEPVALLRQALDRHDVAAHRFEAASPGDVIETAGADSAERTASAALK
jgi:L-ascorbate metabolism protein UlaG (beta-lactamase superfamily)